VWSSPAFTDVNGPGCGVGVGTSTRTAVGSGVSVGIGVSVGAGVGVSVGAGVGVSVGAGVGVSVGTGVGVSVGSGVGSGVFVGGSPPTCPVRTDSSSWVATSSSPPHAATNAQVATRTKINTDHLGRLDTLAPLKCDLLADCQPAAPGLTPRRASASFLQAPR
jgi:hypothetical protein